MTETPKIHWKRIWIEALAIVASILLAFAIDAWWDGRKEAADHSAQIQSLVLEFETAQRHLSVQMEHLQSSLAGTIRVLELMGPDASESEGLQLPAALIESFDVGVSPPQRGVLMNVLASRGNLRVNSTELWSALQSWPTKMGDLEIDGNHLEQNREQDFIAALIRLEVPMSSLIQSRFTQLPADSPRQPPVSKFDADWSRLLRDPGVETIFVMRALRTRMLLRTHENAIQIATGIIKQLDEEL
ncbi:MAG: hypothetical protein GXP15_07905 [Gammaproteobacteria bacterium]|nr:hypothetical protein [Gammaproteobacteria bacterium]